MFDQMKKDSPFALPEIPGIAPTQFNIPAPKKKGGMFGGGGMNPVLAAVLGGLGDYLLQRNGMQPIHAPQMAQRRRQQYEEQQYQRQRTDGMQDWIAKQQYEQANPGPQQPTQTDRYLAELMDPNVPEERKKMLSQVLFPPVMGVVNGVPSMIDRASMFGGAQGGPVGKLTPIEDEGGPSPLGSGGFPGSF